MKKICLFIILLLIFNLTVFASNQKMPVSLNKCVDGDTAKFILNEKIITVRFLAIDTPESVDTSKEVEPYGKEASEYTCNKLKSAKQIYILYDENSDKKDKYNRDLAWVFIDDKLLNNEIVKNGYGKVAYLYGDYLYTNDLKESENLAKKNKLGIWSDYEEDNNIYLVISLIIIITTLSLIFKKDPNKILKQILSYLNKVKR